MGVPPFKHTMVAYHDAFTQRLALTLGMDWNSFLLVGHARRDPFFFFFFSYSFFSSFFVKCK